MLPSAQAQQAIKRRRIVGNLNRRRKRAAITRCIGDEALEECVCRRDEIFWWFKLLAGRIGKIPAVDEIVRRQHLERVAAGHFAEH